ncbi:MAG TPA: hypothetical protein VK402_11915 [Blastococcus sp.]|nr:hypothetical protein [Blastococcus sp.]
MDLNAGESPSDESWTWPPYAPVDPPEAPLFGIDEWAPASSVRRPWVRLGRWTLLYRRSG